MWILFQGGKEIKKMDKVMLEQNKIVGSAHNGSLIRMATYVSELEATEKWSELLEAIQRGEKFFSL